MTVGLALVVVVVGLALGRHLGGIRRHDADAADRQDSTNLRLAALEFEVSRLKRFRREHENKHEQEHERVVEIVREASSLSSKVA
jgi:hypothetical protein